MKFLAALGGVYIIHSLGKGTGGVIVFGAYVVGFFKFIIDKIKGRK